MADNKKSVLLYCDIIHTVKELSNEEAGKLFKHYLEYINDLNPTAPDKLTQVVFEPIKQNLKRDLKKWKEKSERNKKIAIDGWEKRKDANAYERIKSDAINADKDTVTVTVTDTVKDISLKEKKENLIETFFTDLPNSSNFENIIRDSKKSKEYLIQKIPEFRKVSAMEYTHFNSFCDHFKRWVNKQPTNVEPVKKRHQPIG